MRLEELLDVCREHRQRMGFKTSWPNLQEKIMLIVCECAEVIEEHHKLKPNRDKLLEEIVDIIIRSLDLWAGLTTKELEVEILRKLAFNQRRGYKHVKDTRCTKCRKQLEDKYERASGLCHKCYDFVCYGVQL